MPDKIITIENEEGPFQQVLERVMARVPERDRMDKNLKRLIAFRLKIDGEKETRRYLADKIRKFVERADMGSLYAFLEMEMREHGPEYNDNDSEPPEIA
jgi:hypothetical protein